MFEQIKKDCPDAWEKFNLFYYSINTNRLTTKYINSIEIHTIIGDLLLFFDEQGIRIIIEDTIIRHNFKYKINVYDDQKQFNYQEFDITDYPSRLEAWQAAFTKAFEILESK